VISETVDASASIIADPHSPTIILPRDFPMPEGGVNIRWPDAPDGAGAAAAARQGLRGARVRARESAEPRDHRFAQAAPGHHRLGKSYLDVLQGLEDLGHRREGRREIGIRLCKVGMPWPLEPTACASSRAGLEEILVVEEKRQLIEYQLKEQLYNWRDAERPRVIGKYDEHGEWEVARSEWLLPAAGELTPAMVARVIAKRIAKFHTSPIIEARLKFIESKEAELARPRSKVAASRTSARLPAQHLDARARGLEGAGRHRLPLHGDLDPARRDHDLHADGRGGRAVDRHRAVHRDQARLRQPGRRDVLSTPACSRSARRPRPASTSPTRSSSTTRSR
jgi:TPP-dependent indolepyruvate ferredoxin oxidoreductase alpha subunit